jgi:hypothetical protein
MKNGRHTKRRNLERREKRFSSIDEDDDQVLMCKDLPHYMTPYQDADPVTETTRGQQSTSPAISQRTKVSSAEGNQIIRDFLLIKSTFFLFSVHVRRVGYFV